METQTEFDKSPATVYPPETGIGFTDYRLVSIPTQRHSRKMPVVVMDSRLVCIPTQERGNERMDKLGE